MVHGSWRPADLDVMLDLYRLRSMPYAPPRFYSGYNELVYSSQVWNDALPDIIEAFFTIPNQGSWAVARTRDIHRQFLETWKRSEAEVPLLSFDPARWEGPFQPLDTDSKI